MAHEHIKTVRRLGLLSSDNQTSMATKLPAMLMSPSPHAAFEVAIGH